MDLDDILPQIGEFGKYQKLMLWLICLPACFPCGFGAFNQLFMAETPNHWCRVPALSNLTIEARKRLAIPQENGTFAKCARYSLNYSQLEESAAPQGPPPATESCLEGFEFDTTTVLHSSIVVDVSIELQTGNSELSWICGVAVRAGLRQGHLPHFGAGGAQRGGTLGGLRVRVPQRSHWPETLLLPLPHRSHSGGPAHCSVSHFLVVGGKPLRRRSHHSGHLPDPLHHL